MIEYLSGRPSPELSRELAGIQTRSYASIGIRAWSADEIEELAASTHVHIVMARDSHEIVQGFLCLSLLGDEREILSLAIDPEHQRRGIASRLLDMSETGHETIETVRTTLEVADNNIRAVALYEKLGFIDIAMRRRYYCIDGNRVDARVMERRHIRQAGSS